MTYTIDVKAFTDSISDRALEQLCKENPDHRFETDKDGKLIIMSPTGSQSGKRNGDLFGQVWYWNRQQRDSTSRSKFGVSRAQNKLGVVFDSSTGFKLSNGATRSPDVSWIKNDRWNSLSDKQKRGFAPIDPDFVIELLSPICEAVSFRADNLATTQRKMEEYIECGVRLGWLINPDEKEVEIYRLGQDKQVISSPSSLSGEDILLELTLDLSDIF